MTTNKILRPAKAPGERVSWLDGFPVYDCDVCAGPDPFAEHDCPNDLPSMHHADADVSRPFGQGTGSGRSTKTSNPASEKQVEFLVSLGMDRVQAESLTKSKASEHIERLLEERKRQAPAAAPANPASDKQVAFLKKLCAERPMWADVENLHPDVIERLSKQDASAKITEALAVPVERNTERRYAELEDGIYKIDGEVRKVYHTVHGANAQVAKIWTGTEFEYVGKRGLKGLTPEHKMTMAEAVEFGRIYGICCNCSRTLTDEGSIEAGIGPICAQKFA